MRLISNNDKPIQGAVVSIADPEHPEHIFLRAVSDAQGFVNSTVNVPSYLDTLLLTPNYIGLVSSIQLSAKKNTVSAIIGFGVQLPIAASRVSSVTGQSITGSYIQMAKKVRMIYNRQPFAGMARNFANLKFAF